MTDYLLKIKGVVCDAAIFHTFGEADRTAREMVKSGGNEYVQGDFEIVPASQHFGSDGPTGIEAAILVG